MHLFIYFVNDTERDISKSIIPLECFWWKVYHRVGPYQHPIPLPGCYGRFASILEYGFTFQVSFHQVSTRYWLQLDQLQGRRMFRFLVATVTTPASCCSDTVCAFRFDIGIIEQVSHLIQSICHLGMTTARCR